MHNVTPPPETPPILHNEEEKNQRAEERLRDTGEAIAEAALVSKQASIILDRLARQWAANPLTVESLFRENGK